MKNNNPAARTQHQRPNRPAAAAAAGKCSAAGRSMIEMLGVLSIVGILSVGGIYHLGRILTEHRQIRIAEEYAWLVQNVVADFNALRLPKDQRNISSDIAKSPLMPATTRYPSASSSRAAEVTVLRLVSTEPAVTIGTTAPLGLYVIRFSVRLSE